jgi:hypothetical protein
MHLYRQPLRLVWIHGSDNRENKEELKIIVGTVRYGTVRILGSVLKTNKGTDWIVIYHKFEFLKIWLYFGIKKNKLRREV